MAEIISDIYDLANPTPVPLQELSAITISTEIWRNEVDKHRQSGRVSLRAFRKSEESIPLKTILPDLPSQIYDMIEEYVSRFALSMDRWLKDQYNRVFHFHYSHQNYILEDFNDFVADFYGDIDYSRTAERIMQCDRVSVDVKFRIACTYFFEQDIIRIWPSVCEKINSDVYIERYTFRKNPQMNYWIFRLKNELDKVPIVGGDNGNVDETMLHDSVSFSRPSVEYFWNRIPPENRMRKFRSYDESFLRFILPKLNDIQFQELINRPAGYSTMEHLFKNRRFSNELILRIWTRVRDIMTEDFFCRLINSMVRYETSTYGEFYQNHRSMLHLCREIWNSVPANFQRSAIRHVMFTELSFGFGNADDNTLRGAEFLLTILPTATLEERNAFWRKYYERMIRCCYRGTDLQRIMNLCFENETEMIRFKNTFIVTHETVRQLLKPILRGGWFDELNDLICFCCPDIQSSKIFKQNSLRSIFFDPGFRFSRRMVRKPKELDEFIKNSFNTIDEYIDFKIQLMSSPALQQDLCVFADWFSVLHVELVEFLDTFILTEEIRLQMKKRMRDCLEIEFVDADRCYLLGDALLMWCLGSDQEVEKFKMAHAEQFSKQICNF
ncbi:uncharacterized protein LOC135848253 isoform X14 [Planococcus citri]|uniref:uncharacterized protein LOC135848253 isoform X14 n=1 Tax=Planococcus citri TaxID=170843 RepID=UPI0031F8CA47